MTMRSKFVFSEKPGGLPIPYRAESIDAFLEVLQGRRSIRTGFLKGKPVPDELIEKDPGSGAMGSLGWKLAALGIPCHTKLGDSGKDRGDLQDSRRNSSP